MPTFVTQPCDEGVIRSKPAATPCSKTSERWVLTATILGSSMAFIDGTVVNVALPTLQTKLNATVVGVQWVVASYALFLASLLLVGGSLGDRFGRRRVFCIGVALFALASAWCGLAPTIHQLTLARAVQGIGGALLIPGSLAIISSSFSEERRGWAIGTWSGFTAITTAIGPVLGGWLIEHVSWRAIFFINLPLAAVVIALTLRHVPESHDETSEGPLDWRGAALATISLAGIVFGLIESSYRGFSNPAVLIALAIGIVSSAVFFLVEKRIHNPMLPLSLFHSQNFTAANLITFCLYLAFVGMLFFLPMNLIQVHGYKPTAAGAAMLPFVLIVFLLSRWSGKSVNRYGARLLLTVGPAIAAIGFALISRPGIGGNYWTTFFPALAVLGLGMALSVAPLTTTVMNSVDKDRAGLASGINNAMSRTAGLLSIALLGLVMMHIFNTNLDHHFSTLNLPPDAHHALDQQRIKLAAAIPPPNLDSQTQTSIIRALHESFISGFRIVMITSSFLALLSSLTAATLIDRNPTPAQQSRRDGSH